MSDLPFRAILAADTCTMTQSVALLLDGALVSERAVTSRRGHAGHLLASVRDILAEHALTLDKLDLLVVGAGPGSFTGLRIGMASFKGLACACNLPMVALSSLQAIAQQAAATPGLVAPLIDARKREVYAGLYRADEAGVMRPALGDRALSPEGLVEAIVATCAPGEAVTLLGQGLRPYRERLVEGLAHHGVTPRLLGPAFEAPRAAHLATLAASLDPAQLPGLDTLEPNYQRPSDARLPLVPLATRDELPAPDAFKHQ